MVVDQKFVAGLVALCGARNRFAGQSVCDGSVAVGRSDPFSGSPSFKAIFLSEGIPVLVPPLLLSKCSPYSQAFVCCFFFFFFLYIYSLMDKCLICLCVRVSVSVAVEIILLQNP